MTGVKIFFALLLCAGSVFAQLPAPGQPGAPNDPRYIGEPVRNADGSIKRSSSVRAAFVRAFPCPSTLLPGRCDGWSVDHVLPLACGFADRQDNLQWLPNTIKSAAGTLPKDRWERKVYCQPQAQVSP